MTQQAGRGEPAGGGGPRAEHQEGPQRGLRPSGWMSITHTTQGDLFTPFADLNAILSKNTPTQGHPGQWGHPSEHPSWHAGLAITASVGCAQLPRRYAQEVTAALLTMASAVTCAIPRGTFAPFLPEASPPPFHTLLAFSHFNCYSFFFFSPGGSCFILFDSLPLCFQSVPAFTSLMPGHRHP